VLGVGGWGGVIGKGAEGGKNTSRTEKGETNTSAKRVGIVFMSHHDDVAN